MRRISVIENILNSVRKVIIFGKDLHSKYLFCNETTAEAAGLDSPTQILGKTDDDLFWRSYAEFYRSCDNNVLNGKTFVNKQIPFTQPTRIVTTLLSSEVTLTDKNGNPIGVTGHAIDIAGYTVTKNSGYLDPQKNIFYLGENFHNDYFTRREFEVFKYLLIGKHVSEIALILDRSVKTIQAQIKHIAIKLQCTHKSEIVPTAIKYGLTYVLDEINLEKN